MPKLNVLIAGSTGYIGVQLIKLLIKHKNINIKYLCGNSSVGKNISSYDNSFRSKKLPRITKYNKKNLSNVDIIFTALPNGEAQEISKDLLKKNTLIDLAADFRLKKGSGKIYVNGKLFSDYFSSDNHKMQIVRPFELINQATEYDVKCSVKGGGPTGQAGAMVHGISKALVMFDEKLKSTLKTEKLTTRDSRSVERKKPGRKKARRSFQFSKR